jgi:hypothetical protein
MMFSMHRNITSRLGKEEGTPTGRPYLWGQDQVSIGFAWAKRPNLNPEMKINE